MGQCSAGSTWGLGSCGICSLGIAAVIWGLVVQLEVGAWTYSYTEQKDYVWEQARNYCQTYFTDLVAIQNKKEIEYLNQWLPFHPRYYWIGIRKLNGTWTWVGTGKVLTKEAENWAEKEPNNKRSNQDCVEIYIRRQRESGKWNDEPCSKRKRALCYQASCQPFPCSQRGECVETIGNYSCECQPGFHGRDCENVIACPVLSAPDWGELSCSHLHSNFSFGSTCTFSCQTGFVLTGPQSRECTATGDWTGQPPQCEAIKCPALAAPAMGHTACSHLHSNFSFGSTCTFSCQTGFVLTGPQSRECTATGDWTGQPPQCEAIKCPALAAPAMGHTACSHLHSNFSFGSTCTFSCQTGFVLTGPQSRECTATGDWTGQPPQCEAIKCPALAAPAMGHTACSHLHSNFSFGSTCTFSCQTGFVLTGPQSRECTATGDWTGQPPQCEAVTCPVLSAPDWGELSCSHLHSNFSFGSTCTFSCQTGFVLTGPQSRECTATGDWTGQPPQCEAIKCPALAAPAMGHTACSHLHSNFSFGSTCTFSCQTGFVLTGPQSRECTATGDWTGQPPQCEAIKCPALAAPAMGHTACSHLHSNFSFGSTCTFSCQTGFVLTGPQSRECTATGDWTGQPPQCEAIKCPALAAPAMGHTACSHLHSNFSFGSTCTFSCQTGFVLMGPQSRECTATGDWTGQPPQCEAIKCPALAAPAMGHTACSHLHSNFSFGSTCTFSCQTGFVLTGPQSRECTATGDWTGQPPQCEAVTCPVLSAPDWGELSCSHLHSNFSFGSTCTFSCQTGFVLTGPQSRECTATGDWTGQPPQCEAIKCPALAAPAMGHTACSHLHSNFSFGSTCTFSCQTGFVLTGPQSRECTATGDWTGQPPQCEAIKCPALAAPAMGHTACSHLHSNFSFGSTCTFSCQTGFVLTGPQSRECTAMGDWTGQPPQCAAISCPVLDTPSRGRINCSHLHGNFTYNSMCAFSCEAGFVRMGAEVLRCAATGNWTRRPPVCAENAASFLKQVLFYSGSTALVAAGIVLSGTLIALLVKRLSDREEKKKLLNPTSDLGSPGIFTNAAYDSNL